MYKNNRGALGKRLSRVLSCKTRFKLDDILVYCADQIFTIYVHVVQQRSIADNGVVSASMSALVPWRRCSTIKRLCSICTNAVSNSTVKSYLNIRHSSLQIQRKFFFVDGQSDIVIYQNNASYLSSGSGWGTIYAFLTQPIIITFWLSKCFVAKY